MIEEIAQSLDLHAQDARNFGSGKVTVDEFLEAVDTYSMLQSARL